MFVFFFCQLLNNNLANEYDKVVVLTDSEMKQKDLPDVSAVHITLGDYFQDREHNHLYTIGFQLNNSNLKDKLQLSIINPLTNEVSIKDDIWCDDYSYHGFNINYTGYMDIDYDRRFCFIEVNKEDLSDKGRFNYSIVDKETKEVKKGPFEFKSKIHDDSLPEHRVITYGDTDAYNVGKAAIKRMHLEEYDLLILLGDYAYDIFHENGKKGDRFFEIYEPILAKSPVVLTTGNHDTANDSKMLNARFKFPGVKRKTSFSNNFYWFKAAKTIFIQMNLDHITFMYLSRIKDYGDALYNLLKEKKKTKGKDFQYFAFFTHRPFYCVQRAKRCMVDLYYSLPIENILNHFEVDLIFTGHVHDYEENVMYHNFLPAKNIENRKMIIIGSPASDKDPLDGDQYYDMSFNKQYIPEVSGIAEFMVYNNNIKISFIRSVSGKIISQTFLRDEVPVDYTLIALFVFITFTIILTVINVVLMLSKTKNEN